jgi:hypothetical protein
VVGLVQFVPPGEVEEHVTTLRAAGAGGIATSWDGLAAHLLTASTRVG